MSTGNQTTKNPNQQHQTYKLSDNFDRIIDTLNDEIEGLTEKTSDIVVDLINPKNVFDKHSVKVAKKFKAVIEDLNELGYKPPEIGINAVQSLSASLESRWLLPPQSGTSTTREQIAPSTESESKHQSVELPSTEVLAMQTNQNQSDSYQDTVD